MTRLVRLILTRNKLKRLEENVLDGKDNEIFFLLLKWASIIELPYKVLILLQEWLCLALFLKCLINYMVFPSKRTKTYYIKA